MLRRELLSFVCVCAECLRYMWTGSLLVRCRFVAGSLLVRYLFVAICGKLSTLITHHAFKLHEIEIYFNKTLNRTD